MVFIVESFYTMVHASYQDQYRYHEEEVQAASASDAVADTEATIRTFVSRLGRSCTFTGAEVSCNDGETDIFAVARSMP